MQGTLAFDLDGTLTEEATSIPENVIKSLEKWSASWNIALITGRPFRYAEKALTKLNFPFYLGLQNGADIIAMPRKEKLSSHYVKRAILQELDTIYKNFEESFLIYAGFEKGDVCYYRPHLFSQEMLAYIKQVEKLTYLPFKGIKELDELAQEGFPLIKCVGKKEVVNQIAKKLEIFSFLHLSQVKDPLFPMFDLLLITDKQANKGKAIEGMLQAYNLSRPLIVAGDDNNDIPMLRVADYAIGMRGGSKNIEPFIDVLIPFDKGEGLIKAVEEGMRFVCSQ